MELLSNDLHLSTYPSKLPIEAHVRSAVKLDDNSGQSILLDPYFLKNGRIDDRVGES